MLLFKECLSVAKDAITTVDANGHYNLANHFATYSETSLNKLRESREKTIILIRTKISCMNVSKSGSRVVST